MSMSRLAIVAEQKTTKQAWTWGKGPLTNGHRPFNLLLNQPI
jgi:hypothetical protein